MNIEVGAQQQLKKIAFVDAKDDKASSMLHPDEVFFTGVVHHNIPSGPVCFHFVGLQFEADESERPWYLNKYIVEEAEKQAAERAAKAQVTAEAPTESTMKATPVEPVAESTVEPVDEAPAKAAMKSPLKPVDKALAEAVIEDWESDFDFLLDENGDEDEEDEEEEEDDGYEDFEYFEY